MALEGTLKDFNLPDIFQLIGYQRKTGMLTLSREGEQITVSLQDGDVVWASPGHEAFEDMIGRALVKHGLINQGVLERLVRKRRETQQGLVYLVLKHGNVEPLEVQRIVEVKVREVLYRVFRWRDGRYQFTALPKLDLSHGQIDPMTAEGVLMEAVRQIDEWPAIQRQLPSLDLKVSREEGQAGALDVEKLTSAERAVLELADGRSTARDIAEASGLGEFDAAKAIADLLGNGVLVLASDQGEARAVAAPRRPWVVPSWLIRGLLIGAMAAALYLHVGPGGRDPLLLLPVTGEVAAGWDLLRQHKLQADLREVERSLHVYLLTTGQLPPRLEVLADAGYLSRRLLHDPWGQPLRYQVQGLQYRLEGSRALPRSAR